MAILNFKPHYIWERHVTGGYLDYETGDYYPGTTTWSKYMECDIKPAMDENPIIRTIDATYVEYDYIVYLSTKCRNFNIGELVKLTLFGKDEERVYCVTGFHRYQLQCKMWIVGT